VGLYRAEALYSLELRKGSTEYIIRLTCLLFACMRKDETRFDGWPASMYGDDCPMDRSCLLKSMPTRLSKKVPTVVRTPRVRLKVTLKPSRVYGAVVGIRHGLRTRRAALPVRGKVPVSATDSLVAWRREMFVVIVSALLSVMRVQLCAKVADLVWRFRAKTFPGSTRA
jgi:hypothetical protein